MDLDRIFHMWLGALRYLVDLFAALIGRQCQGCSWVRSWGVDVNCHRRRFLSKYIRVSAEASDDCDLRRCHALFNRTGENVLSYLAFTPRIDLRPPVGRVAIRQSVLAKKLRVL